MSEACVQPGRPALELRGVSITSMKSSATLVAAEVNWTIEPGDFWVVGAPQLSGKTDFLMTMGGLRPPAAGEYFLLGERMPIFDQARLAHRLKLGFVFEGGQLLGHLTVAENIALPLRYHARLSPVETEERVRELLEWTQLVPWAHSTPANVGHSWRRRAGLARALALQPQVLLLDSPLTGLDGRQVWWWREKLDALSRGDRIAGGSPVTLVATADDLLPWRRHARQVACLANRRLSVLGDWSAAEQSTAASVRELLRD